MRSHSRIIYNNPTRFVLVQWQGLLQDDTSRDKWDELRSIYDLDNKVDLEEGSNDKDPAVGPSVGMSMGIRGYG